MEVPPEVQAQAEICYNPRDNLVWMAPDLYPQYWELRAFHLASIIKNRPILKKLASPELVAAAAMNAWDPNTAIGRLHQSNLKKALTHYTKSTN